MNANALKRQVARLFDAIGINSLGHLVQRSTLFPFVRVVNYHGIPANFAGNFETQLKFYRSRFVNVTYPDLMDFLHGGKWQHDKPGLILSFDDGLRSHYEVAAPLLEEYGFTGWFFVPAGWLAPADGGNIVNEQFPAGIATLTHAQLLYLDKHHTIGCHTQTHCRLRADLPPEKMKYETLEAQKSLEALLGHPVKIFCWVGGEEHTYSKSAADLIKRGYELSFMTNTAVVRPSTNPLQLQRTNIEAENSLSLVRFQLSGLMDIAHYRKRKRVNALTQ